MSYVILGTVQGFIKSPGTCKTYWRVAMTTSFPCTGGFLHCLTVIDDPCLQRQKKDLHNCQENCTISSKQDDDDGDDVVRFPNPHNVDFQVSWRIWLVMMMTRTMTRTMMMICSQERENGGWERTLLLHSQSCEQQSSDQRSRGPNHGECDCGWLFWWWL